MWPVCKNSLSCVLLYFLFCIYSTLEWKHLSVLVLPDRLKELGFFSVLLNLLVPALLFQWEFLPAPPIPPQGWRPECEAFWLTAPAVRQGKLTCDLGVVRHSDPTDIVVGCSRNLACTSGPVAAEKNKGKSRLSGRFLKSCQLEAIWFFSMGRWAGVSVMREQKASSEQSTSWHPATPPPHPQARSVWCSSGPRGCPKAKGGEKNQWLTSEKSHSGRTGVSLSFPTS